MSDDGGGYTPHMDATFIAVDGLAREYQNGVRAVDVFYVKDLFGLKVENERKLDGLRGAVLAALGNGPGPGEPARAA